MTAILIESALRSLLLGLVAGLGLWQCRTRNPQTESTVWITVLLASLATPLLLQWPILRVSLTPSTLTTLGLQGMGQAMPGAAPAAAHAAATPGLQLGPWLLLGIYLAVAGTLLLRILVGLVGTWRILRRAQPVHGGWTQGLDVRVTESVEAPVSFGQIVLLPMAWLDWSLVKRRAVISHERAHIENHDFVVQLIARLHTAIFWFSPLAWWLQLRLAFLAERTSDEAATAVLGSRIDYAEILLDIAVGGRGLPEAIAMARPALLHRRVESLLSRNATGFTVSPRRRLMLVLALLPPVLAVAGTAWHASAADLALPGRADNTGSHTITMPGAPNFVLLREGRIRTNAGSGAVERMMAAQQGHGDALLFALAGTVYAVTDPALLDEADALVDGAPDTARQLADLARQRADLGRQHGDIGRQQGDIGRQMGDLAREHARDGGTDAQYSQAMAVLRQQMDALGKGHAQLGLEEAKLAQQEEHLRQAERREADRNGGALQALIDRALQDGKAARIGAR